MSGPFDGELHGTTILGARGQVVIPVEVRKKLGLKQNEKLLVVTKKGVIMLAKTEEVNKFLSKHLDELIKMKENISKVK